MSIRISAIIVLVFIVACTRNSKVQVPEQNADIPIEYSLPDITDIGSVLNAQYDLKPFAKEISKFEKVELLNELIKELDTLSCSYFTPFEDYTDFVQQMDSFALNIPEELDRNLQVLKINGDDEYDFIYDRVHSGWDFQDIYVMIREANGWRSQKIPGFIILDIKREEGRINYMDTYQWACCSCPYDIFNRLKLEGDSLLIASSTGIGRNTVVPGHIIIDSSIKMEMKTDSLHLISVSNQIPEEGYSSADIEKVEFISERKIDDQELVFTRIKFNKQHIAIDFDYLLAWVKREEVNIIKPQ